MNGPALPRRYCAAISLSVSFEVEDFDRVLRRCRRSCSPPPPCRHRSCCRSTEVFDPVEVLNRDSRARFGSRGLRSRSRSLLLLSIRIPSRWEFSTTFPSIALPVPGGPSTRMPNALPVRLWPPVAAADRRFRTICGAGRTAFSILDRDAAPHRDHVFRDRRLVVQLGSFRFERRSPSAFGGGAASTDAAGALRPIRLRSTQQVPGPPARHGSGRRVDVVCGRGPADLDFVGFPDQDPDRACSATTPVPAALRPM